MKVGTDCSGIEAPMQALQRLHVPFDHVFSSEINPFAIQSIEANYKPKQIYGDITKRNHKLLPDIDVYVAGAPCQPFSALGLGKASNDTRADVLQECIKVIKIKKPKVFILENVPRLVSVEKGELFKATLAELNRSGSYHIYHELLNTKHYGLPQNRLRLFIIGIRKDIQRPNMTFTTPKQKKMTPLDNILIDHKVYDVKPCATSQRNIDAVKDYDTHANYVATWMGFGRPAMKELAPTLCAKTCSGMYFTKYKRHIYVKEALALQGFPKNFKQVVSDSQMFKQVGNSMSVCVLVALFSEIFRVARV